MLQYKLFIKDKLQFKIVLEIIHWYNNMKHAIMKDVVQFIFKQVQYSNKILIHRQNILCLLF